MEQVQGSGFGLRGPDRVAKTNRSGRQKRERSLIRGRFRRRRRKSTADAPTGRQRKTRKARRTGGGRRLRKGALCRVMRTGSCRRATMSRAFWARARPGVVREPAADITTALPDEPDLPNPSPAPWDPRLRPPAPCANPARSPPSPAAQHLPKGATTRLDGLLRGRRQLRPDEVIAGGLERLRFQCMRRGQRAPARTHTA